MYWKWNLLYDQWLLVISSYPTKPWNIIFFHRRHRLYYILNNNNKMPKANITNIKSEFNYKTNWITSNINCPFTYNIYICFSLSSLNNIPKVICMTNIELVKWIHVYNSLSIRLFFLHWNSSIQGSRKKIDITSSIRWMIQYTSKIICI